MLVELITVKIFSKIIVTLSSIFLAIKFPAVSKRTKSLFEIFGPKHLVVVVIYLKKKIFMDTNLYKDRMYSCYKDNHILKLRSHKNVAL